MGNGSKAKVTCQKCGKEMTPTPGNAEDPVVKYQCECGEVYFLPQ